MFYAENTFDISLEEESVNTHSGLFQVDMTCVRKCRLLFPEDPLDAIDYLPGVVKRLNESHQMQHMLIDGTFVDKELWGSLLEGVALDLSSVRNVKSCHFEGFGKALEPGLTILSRLIMSDDVASIPQRRWIGNLAALQSWAKGRPWMQDNVADTLEETERTHAARIRELYAALRIPYPLGVEEKF